MAKKRVMVLTGGGDCPGLNAVIRGIVKRASLEKDWEVIGCIESFNGVLREPTEIVVLDERSVAGLLVEGGTILGTTNKGGPFAWPIKNQDGTWTTVDRSDEMIRKLQYMGVDAVITDLEQTCIGVSTADCIPVLLHDTKRDVIAAIHAGWRGTVAMIVCKAIDKMKMINKKAEATIFKGVDLCLNTILKNEGIDFGNYAMGPGLKRKLISMELTGTDL